MHRGVLFKILWTIWMAGGGLTAAVIAYSLTSSWWWALGALLGSGVVLNAVGQAVTRPVRAPASRHRSAAPPRGGSLR